MEGQNVLDRGKLCKPPWFMFDYMQMDENTNVPGLKQAPNPTKHYLLSHQRVFIPLIKWTPLLPIACLQMRLGT